MRAFAQSIVDTVRHPMLVLDTSERVLKANATFYRTFGLSADATEGRELRSLPVMRWLPSLRDLSASTRSDAGLDEVEMACDIPGLGRRIMTVSARPVSHDDGAQVVLLSLEDATVQVEARELMQRLNDELEERVRQRTAQLQAANAELEAFSYSVSHDLRAPLRALDGFSEELLRSYVGKPLDGRAEHYLRRIRAGSQRMAHLIDDLLRLARLTRIEIRQERVDITGLALDVVADLRQRDRTREVTTRVQPDMSATGDAGLMRIVLENLIGNAWKFSSRKEQPTIEVGSEQRAGKNVFFVKDDGAGFDPAHAARMFGAFQRLHDEREYPGNGVGLATVQRIVHRHGGRVWAAASPGAGATFYFELGSLQEISRLASRAQKPETSDD